jgi:ribonuclease BN (tRNA processing enzyme)
VFTQRTDYGSARSKSITAARIYRRSAIESIIAVARRYCPGDTTFDENLIEHARGADLLVHEVTAVAGSAAENAEQLKRISSNHTRPQQAGEIFRPRRA